MAVLMPMAVIMPMVVIVIMVMVAMVMIVVMVIMILVGIGVEVLGAHGLLSDLGEFEDVVDHLVLEDGCAKLC
jgi:hypothetical protein